MTEYFSLKQVKHKLGNSPLLGYARAFTRKFNRQPIASPAQPPVTRATLAAAYLHGEGLEIGALHAPVPVGPTVKVKYVDLLSRQESIARFPELDPNTIVEPDYIMDGFKLAEIPAASQDFIIANHVLEHSPNPIELLLAWARVIRHSGIMFVGVPIAEKCFDKGRSETTLAHLIEDYTLYSQAKSGEIRARNRAHYAEWFAISEPNIALLHGGPPFHLTEQQQAQRVEQALDDRQEIHFHTFSFASYTKFIQYMIATHLTAFKLREVVECANYEAIAILESCA